MSSNNSAFTNSGNQTDNRIRRYNRILEGINRIFSNVVQVKTEEELGNTCLSVVLEVTGSQIGFVAEVDADGLSHDIAVSDMGWSQCLMYDKTGHRRPPGDFVIHGLYGHVIDSGKGFFTNDPLSHPDSIGLPEGHPPLTSFLGVPLIQDEKTIGMIAVANREGGYSCEQQEDLEAIAPAVTQALGRKREEQERTKAEEALSRERSLLESVMQTTDVMLVLLDPQFNFVWVNSAYAETCKMKPEEMVGKNHFALYPNAENEAIFRIVRDTGKGVFYKDRPFVFPNQPERGVTYWDWSLAPVKNSCGDVEGLVFSLRETTKYKQVEKALRESEALNKISRAVEAERQRLFDVLETLPIMITLLTPDHHIAFANRSFRERFGEFCIRKCYEYCFGRTNPCEFCEAYKVLETGQPHHWEVNMPDGSVFDTYDLPFTDVDGSPMILEMDIDITKRKKAEEVLANIETARKKEIHHRIKNNLQVISSLLDLQAEQFRNRENIKDSEVLEAFRESQDRVISMALIHEELYKGEKFETLNFSPYIQKLTENLLETYSLGDTEISLNMDLEENLFFDMDTAVPLGMIINELVSDSLKYAFIGKDKGEIRIKLHREEPTELESEDSESTSTTFILTISDNGVGIPEDLEIEDLDSLGFQLVTSLVDQLDGEFELKRNNGTEFIIRFIVIETNNLLKA